MAVIKSSGEENLRADPHVYSGSQTGSPSSGGKDAGGTSNLRANQQTKQAATKDTGTYSRDVKPAGVQSFRDMAKE
jgi:hypothetical protein